MAHTSEAQIFVSTDRGGQWQSRPFPAEHQGVMHTLAIDPLDPQLWLAGVEDERGQASGLYRTTNGGKAWQRPPGLAGQAVWSLAVSESHAGLVIAGTADGVFRSTDRGETWERISPQTHKELRPVVSLAIDPTDANKIIAGTTHLPWRTTDGGNTWRSIHSGMLDDSDVFSVAMHPKRVGIVYASACSGAYRSSNGGTLWSRLATPRGAFRTYVVAVDVNEPNVVFAGTSSGLLRSANEGRTWTKVSPHAVYSIDFEGGSGGRIYFASGTGGILVSDDGGKQLRATSSGFTNRRLASLVRSNSDLFVLHIQGDERTLFASSDLGRTWTDLDIKRLGTVNLLASSPDGAVHAASNNQVFKSEDQGRTWKLLGTPLQAGRIDALAVGGASGEILIASAGSRLYKQDSKGSWLALSVRLTGRIHGLHANGRTLTVATRSGVGFSTDAGATWQPCQTPNTDIEWYEAAWTGRKVLIAATSHGLLKSSDCANWSTLRDGLETGTVSAIYVDPNGALLASQAGKVYRSAADGADWLPITEVSGFKSMPTRLMLLPGEGQRIFALFTRAGVAELRLGSEGLVPVASQRTSATPEQSKEE